MQENMRTHPKNIEIAHRHMNVEIGLRPRNSFSGNTSMRFRFSVVRKASSLLNSMISIPEVGKHVPLLNGAG
jgi:hypothetical protein